MAGLCLLHAEIIAILEQICQIMELCFSVLGTQIEGALDAPRHVSSRRKLVISGSPAIWAYEDIVLWPRDVSLDRDWWSAPTPLRK